MVAVVHLVWGPLGPSPLRGFLDSYRRCSAGVDHELIIALNGVTSSQRPELEAELQGVEHKLMLLKEPVQDLEAYGQASAELKHDRLCFVNSYSEILVDGWLAKLDDAVSLHSVGLVGATGSWASTRSAVLNGLFLPNAYRGVIPERRIARQQLVEMETEKQISRGGLPATSKRTVLDSIRDTVSTFPRMPEQLIRFGGFPARHLRTNAFMGRRSLLNDLKIVKVKRKMDAYLLESGRNSLTQRVVDMGLRTLVVDRYGDTFTADQWPNSYTLWQGDQERLMISDNQTYLYANGGFDRRRLLAAFAWGRLAKPSAPRQGSVIEASR